MTMSFAPFSLARMTRPPMVGSCNPRSTPFTMMASLVSSSATELVLAGTPSMASRTSMLLLRYTPSPWSTLLVPMRARANFWRR